MGKFQIIIDVDEEVLNRVSKENGFEEVSTIEKIENEMGWVHASGISIVSVEPVTEK